MAKIVDQISTQPAIQFSPISAYPRPTPSPDTTVLDLLNYRAEIARWAAEVIKELVVYIQQYTAVIDAQDLPELVFEGEGGKETTAQDNILSLAGSISSKTEPIVDAMLEVIEKQFVTDPPDFDIQGVIDLIEDELKLEFGTGVVSIWGFRNLYYGFLQAILLTNYFTLPTSETTRITTAVDAHIARAKSNANGQILLLERQNINSLASRGVLDSTIASDLLSRLGARNARTLAEIEYEAEGIRFQYTSDALNRLNDQARIRIEAFQKAPIEMQSAIANILGSAVAARFLNPQQFINSLPSVLGTAMQGLSDLMGSLQTNRHKKSDWQINQMNSIGTFLQAIVTGFTESEKAIAKFATLEAS